MRQILSRRTKVKFFINLQQLPPLQTFSHFLPFQLWAIWAAQDIPFFPFTNEEEKSHPYPLIHSISFHFLDLKPDVPMLVVFDFNDIFSFFRFSIILIRFYSQPPKKIFTVQHRGLFMGEMCPIFQYLCTSMKSRRIQEHTVHFRVVSVQ